MLRLTSSALKVKTRLARTETTALGGEGLSRSQSHDSFGADSGPSRGHSRRPAFRPLETIAIRSAIDRLDPERKLVPAIECPPIEVKRPARIAAAWASQLGESRGGEERVVSRERTSLSSL
jgi:hypothetical protein